MKAPQIFKIYSTRCNRLLLRRMAMMMLIFSVQFKGVISVSALHRADRLKDFETVADQTGSSVTLQKFGVLHTDLAGAPEIANPGDQVTYSFTVKNTGSTVLTNIYITDSQAIVTGGPILMLNPGVTNTTTFTAVHTLTQEDIDAGEVINTAVVTASTPDGPDITAEATDTTAIPQLADIDLIKSGTPDFGPDGVAQAGEHIFYFFLVVNTGNVTLQNVTLADPMVSVTGGPVAVMPPDVPFHNVFYADYMVTQADIDSGVVVNTATVTGLAPSGQPVFHTDDHIQPLGQVMFIDMEKIGEPHFGADGIPQAGETISYTYLVTNTSNVTLTNITISDPLVPPSGGPIPILLPGAADDTTFSATYTLTQADVDSGYFSNTATVTGYNPLNEPVTHTDRHTQPLTRVPSLSLVVSGALDLVNAEPADLANPGDQVNYQFRITNTGNTSLYSISITEPLATITGNPLAYLGPGQTDSLTITASRLLTQPDIDTGFVTGIFAISATAAGDSVVTAGMVHAQAIPQMADIDMIKSGTPDFGPDGIAQAGEHIYYFFLVVNTGNVTLHNVTLTDPMVTVTGGPIIIMPPDVPFHNVFFADYIVTQADIDSGVVINTATVAGLTPSGQTVFHTDDHIQPLDQVMFIDMEKIGEPHFGADGIPQAGETITYRYLITNTSNVTLTNITVFDSLVPAAGGPIPALLPGAVDQETFMGVYSLSQADIDSGYFSNTATVTGYNPVNEAVTHTDRHTQPLPHAPSIALDIQGALVSDIVPPAGVPDAGDQVSYVFRITNLGNTTLYNIQITDTLAAVTGGPIPVLAPGATDSLGISAVHVLTAEDIAAGQFLNAADVAGFSPHGVLAAAADTDLQNLVAPRWTLSKTASEESYSAMGDILHYTIVLANTGNQKISSVVVSDPGADPGSLVRISGDMNLDNILDPDETWTFSATHTITVTDLAAGHYLNTATAHGVASAGFVQDATAAADVPVLTSVVGIVAGGEIRCYGAVHTLTVAGGGTSFTIHPGGSATLAAGYRVRILPGTVVHGGGYLHGLISEHPCGFKEGKEENADSADAQAPFISQITGRIKIYPNPATGRFFAEVPAGISDAIIAYELFDLQGTRVADRRGRGGELQEFRVEGLSAGLYLLRIVTGDRTEILRVIVGR